VSTRWVWWWVFVGFGSGWTFSYPTQTHTPVKGIAGTDWPRALSSPEACFAPCAALPKTCNAISLQGSHELYYIARLDCSWLCLWMITHCTYHCSCLHMLHTQPCVLVLSTLPLIHLLPLLLLNQYYPICRQIALPDMPVAPQFLQPKTHRSPTSY